MKRLKVTLLARVTTQMSIKNPRHFKYKSVSQFLVRIEMAKNCLSHKFFTTCQFFPHFIESVHEPTSFLTQTNCVLFRSVLSVYGYSFLCRSQENTHYTVLFIFYFLHPEIFPNTIYFLLLLLNPKKEKKNAKNSPLSDENSCKVGKLATRKFFDFVRV